MYTPYNSRHFTVHIDSVSNARFAVLSTHIAPVQKGFYFREYAWTKDGRYLWFQCAFPPADADTIFLAVIDFLTDEIHYFPETAITCGWGIDIRTGNAYWGTKQGIFKRTPHPQDKPVLIARLPKEITDAGLRWTHVGTSITFTPDYKELLVDIQTYKRGSVIGTFDIVTGEFTEWYRTKRGIPFNHANINPVDRNLCLCAHEYLAGYDPTIEGDGAPALVDGVYPRLRIITRDGKCTISPPLHGYASHEWWSADGKSIFYVHPGYAENTGAVCRNYLDGRESEVICKINTNIPNAMNTWHAHCSKDEKYFVIDGADPGEGKDWWRGCESFVHFYNTETGKLFRFLTKNPAVDDWTPDHQCPYHIDPHPGFELNDTMITFTTTVCGRVDLAVIDVEQLIEATK